MADRPRLRLAHRDMAILEQLLQRRADTLDTLHSRFFADAIRAAARNRLSALARHGYIERHQLHHPDGEPYLAYTLGPQAAPALRQRSVSAGELLRTRRFNPVLRETSIPHQLAINQVADTLDVRLTPEHLLDWPANAGERKHRPDAAYRATPDALGRSLVLVEVDLGHYSRQRILEKMRTFLQHPGARSILFIHPTDQRATTIANWIRAEHGDQAMNRVQPLTFNDLGRAGILDLGTEPADPDTLDALDPRAT